MRAIGAFPKLGTLATGPQASFAREAEGTPQINYIDIRVPRSHALRRHRQSRCLFFSFDRLDSPIFRSAMSKIINL